MIPGVGLPPGSKRPTPDSFDDSATKKAKNNEGQDKSETMSTEGEPTNDVKTGEVAMTEYENKSKETPINEGESKPKESEITKETDVEEKISGSGDSQKTEKEKTPKESEMKEEQVTPKKPPSGYRMNINRTLVQAHRGTPLRKVVDLPVTVLKGINEEQARVLLHDFKVKTVRDLANWRFHQIARSIDALADVEEKDGRLETSLQNINDAVDKKFEKRSLNTIMEQKAEVVQGIGKYLQELLNKVLGIITMKDLSNYKPAKYAAALVALADYETTGFESKTTPDDSKPLSTFRPVAG